jgi:hypothetical protein
VQKILGAAERKVHLQWTAMDVGDRHHQAAVPESLVTPIKVPFVWNEWMIRKPAGLMRLPARRPQ